MSSETETSEGAMYWNRLASKIKNWKLSDVYLSILVLHPVSAISIEYECIYS